MGDVIGQAAEVLWGLHEAAAECSHRPEHVRKLFVDANAAHRFAEALAEAGLLMSPEQQAVLDAAERWDRGVRGSAIDHEVWWPNLATHTATEIELARAVRALRASTDGSDT